MKCIYCEKEGMKIGGNLELNPVFMCKIHHKIMNIPELAIPFLRGRLAGQLRGTMPKEELDKRISLFIKYVSAWKPKYH